MLLPVAFIWMAGLGRFLKLPAYRILGIIYLGIITLLLLSSGKGYYALGVYPMLLAGGAVAWGNFSHTRQWIRFVIVTFIIAFN